MNWIPPPPLPLPNPRPRKQRQVVPVPVAAPVIPPVPGLGIPPRLRLPNQNRFLPLGEKSRRVCLPLGDYKIGARMKWLKSRRVCQPLGDYKIGARMKWLKSRRVCLPLKGQHSLDRI